MRYCLEVCAYTAVNINVTRGVTNVQMRKRRETEVVKVAIIKKSRMSVLLGDG
jgi:hypothetical protein